MLNYAGEADEAGNAGEAGEAQRDNGQLSAIKHWTRALNDNCHLPNSPKSQVTQINSNGRQSPASPAY